MIQNLNDMPVAVKNAPENTQSFVILKDHLVVSRINILKQEAFKRRIPIIASDEGSVISGATIAVGVQEKQIGVEAGLMAKKILQGIEPKDIPFGDMQDLTLFINLKSFVKQDILTKENLSVLPFTKKKNLQSSNMNILVTALEQSLIMLPLILGMYISYRILKITDLTVDGTYVLGAAVFARTISLGLFPALIFAVISGGIIGSIVSLCRKITALTGL